jgi:hypothetical protein
MKKTVTMRKGDRFADIFDSPETIAQAQKDGYHVCDDDELEAREALSKADAKKQPKEKTAGGKSDEADALKGLAGLDIKGLRQFAGQRKIYDKSWKELEKDALLEKILETVKAKVVEAGLKTAEDVAELTESDLIVLFDGIGK